MAVGSREDARPRRDLDPYKEAIGGISAFSLYLLLSISWPSGPIYDLKTGHHGTPAFGLII